MLRLSKHAGRAFALTLRVPQDDTALFIDNNMLQPAFTGYIY
jgi:hypothetical protein